MATPPPTPPRALSSGYLSVRTDKVINSWKKPLFFAFVDSAVALDRLELVYKKGVKEVAETKARPAAEASAADEDVAAAPAEKSAFEAANERLFRAMAAAAVSGSGILAAYKSNGEEDLKRPVMLINFRDITDVTLCPKFSKKNRHAFAIHTQGEKMVVATPVAEELEQWVKTIQRRYRITGDDDIEANGEYRSVYELLVAKKAFTKEAQVETAVAEVTPEVEIAAAEAPAPKEAGAEVVEKAKQEVEVAAAEESTATEETAAVVAEENKSQPDEVAVAAAEATSAPVEGETQKEDDAKLAVETAATEPTDAAVPEEPSAAAEEFATAVDAAFAEAAPQALAAAAEPQEAAETPAPATKAPAVAAKPKSTFMASIASLLKRKPAGNAADKAVPQDIDDHVDDVAPAAVSAPAQADAEVPEIEVTAPGADETAAEATDVEAAAGEPAGERAASSQKEEDAPAAASAPPSKKGIFRFFSRKPVPAKAADAAARAEADAALEEPQAVAEADASEPAEGAAAPVVADAPEEKAAEVEDAAVAVEAGGPADAQPKEVKPATGILGSLSRLFKKRARAAPVADAAEGAAEGATDSAVETEAVAEEAAASASETAAQDAVEVAAKECAGEEPAAEEEPAAKEAAAEEPAVAKEPAAKEAAAEEPAGEEPAAKEAAAEEPAAEKPAAEEDASAGKPAVEEEPAGKEAAAEEAAGESVPEAAKPAGRTLARSFSMMVKKVVAK